MKNKKVFIIVIAFTAVLISSYVPYRMSQYTTVIKLNWKIDLPIRYTELYAEDSGPSFHGDGTRYHVFQYQQQERLHTLLNWTEDGISRSGKSFRITAEEWLDELNVPAEFRPDYDTCIYYYKIQNDSSELIILYESKINRLYVLEHFL